MENYSVVGKRLPRIDANVKVTGDAKYTGDMILPGMLYGKILKSPLPHAKIINIDAGKALKLKGVRAVITGKDTYGIKYCIIDIPQALDKCPLAVDKVRYIGDEVAAVAAIDEDTAEEALDLIEVEYEELPAVFDPIEAMEPDAPKVHEEKENNIAMGVSYQLGNVEEGFKNSFLVREDEFKTQAIQHVPMEPHATIGHFDSSGKVTVWSGTQSPYFIHRDLARTLNIPESKVRVIKPYTGSGFGGKTEMHSHDFCAALLSKKTGRPVKIVYTREELFTNTRLRHPIIIGLKTGVKKDGTIMAYDIKAVLDGGAYNSTGPLATFLFTYFPFLVYRMEHYRINSTNVYTNKPFCGAMRGHGAPQGRFAFESQLDMIAEELGIDPVEIRLKNAISEGEVLLNKTRIKSCGLKDCIKKSSESLNWKEIEPHKGIGMGCQGFVSGANIAPPYDATGTIIKAHEDGGVTVLTGASDIGQGSDSIIAQIVAEELGIKLEDIRIIAADTEITPLEPGSFSSRVTLMSGNSAKAAASDVKQQLFEIVAEKLEANVEDLDARDRRIFVKGSPDRGMSFKDAITASFGDKEMPVLGRGHYYAKVDTASMATGECNMSRTYSFASHAAEVEVDPETGLVKIIKHSAAHDCGRAINPMAVEGQLEGSVSMGQGFTLLEKVYIDKGQVLNPNLLEYKIPTSLDSPEIESIPVEAIDNEGPFGAKEAGEGATNPVAPAIANAIYKAAGARVYELPITPEKIVNSLEEQ
ncbi:MAG: molybdopterin cofactor-binding domain-containing protein [Thermodesulfobacteriota bacterium]|nr:molybdopterin cofactor-binding domain-containing protein [Thermodesulfobacteriota bacterium]